MRFIVYVDERYLLEEYYFVERHHILCLGGVLLFVCLLNRTHFWSLGNGRNHFRATGALWSRPVWFAMTFLHPSFIFIYFFVVVVCITFWAAVDCYNNGLLMTTHLQYVKWIHFTSKIVNNNDKHHNYNANIINLRKICKILEHFWHLKMPEYNV